MTINLPNYERQTSILQNTEEIKSILPIVGKKKRTQTFTSSGTWVAPNGVTKVYVTGGGGGGSGAAQTTSDNANGLSGGVTSFGNLLSLSGGQGGLVMPGQTEPNKAGGPGGQGGGIIGGPITSTMRSILTGNSGPYFGGASINGIHGIKAGDGGYCSGGGCILQTQFATCGAGGDFVYNKELNITPGTSYPITIGLGGASVRTPSGSASGKGGDGILTIEWWE